MQNNLTKEKELLYNKMFNALVVNIYSKSKEMNGRIKEVHINLFNPDDFYHSVVLFAANTATTIWGGEIYLHMPLFQFLKWKLPRRKTHKNIHWLRKLDATHHGLGPMAELNFVTKGFEQHPSIWWDIYQEFFAPTPVSEEEKN